MPTYIFKNKKSKEVFEIQMRISELDDYKLKNPNLIQMPTAPSFRLKGTGWYETDFKTGKKKNIAIKDSDKSDEKKAIEKKGIKEKEVKKEEKKEVKETKDEK
tara:strand:+ start:74074 stop:74382 length:309 start_codon:yes stop_codon:yes gene_type:complete